MMTMSHEMSIITEIETQSEPGWDASIAAGTCGLLTLYHTTAWAERMRDLLGYQPLFITVAEGGTPILRLLALVCRPQSIRGFGNIARHVVPAAWRGRIGSLMWYGEPVVVGEASQEHYRDLALSLDREARRRWLRVSAGNWPTAHEVELTAGWTTRRWGTLQVDLTRSKENLLVAVKSSARKAVRRAEREGIEVRRVASLDQLRSYYSFATRCARRYDKRMHGFEDFQSMWEHIRPNGWFETFVAEHEGEMIAGLSVWGHGDSIGELGSFQSERSFADKLYGPDLIKWEILQWGHDQGLRQLDLGGVNPAPEGKEVGIRQFKEKWGGVYYEYTTIG